MSTVQRTGLGLGVVVFLVLLVVFPARWPEHSLALRMAAVAGLMAVWWITDAIPLAATALLPVVLYPVLGIMSGKSVAPVYVNDVIFLFLGGFMIALAMERWKLHRRIALGIIRLVGGSANRLAFGFLAASALLSMWISNTATAIMMVAIGQAIVIQTEEDFGKERCRPLSLGLMLCIAYGCTVGGVATLVGTPPNLSFARIYAMLFEDAPAISFGQWMLLGLPLCLIMLGVVWVLITQVFCRVPRDIRLAPDTLRDQWRQLGPLRFSEAAVLVVFLATALLWVFRADLVIGPVTIPGWSRLSWLPESKYLTDGTVAVTMALILFFIPSREPGDARRLLDIDVFKGIPWHIVLLFGGGFALAKGFGASGLSELIGGGFSGLAGVSPILLIAVICLSITFLTELTSNTATTEMILPILASAAVAMQVHPLLLMLPATLSASFAFMMPVATPPNAIVFGSGRVRIADMARVGIVINFIGAAVITLAVYFIGALVFGIELGAVPDWARAVAK